MRELGNFFIGIGAFAIFLSVVFYFYGYSTGVLVIYYYRPETSIAAAIGVILLAIGVLIKVLKRA